MEYILIFLIIGYLVFFGVCFSYMLEKTDNGIIPILLSLIPVFNVVYVIYIKRNTIKKTFKELFNE